MKLSEAKTVKELREVYNKFYTMYLNHPKVKTTTLSLDKYIKSQVPTEEESNEHKYLEQACELLLSDICEASSMA
tara:strand:+ start:410 stop:634 length:225 start_codon:yes stop_codon:yes gene_type:complete